MAEQDEPLANYDPWVEGGVHGFIGKPIARYDIIFEDEEQLKRWYAFIRGLKAVYPKERTIGGRINQFLVDRELGIALLTPPPEKKSTRKGKKDGVTGTHDTHTPTGTGASEG
jgi:hypothetical protein